MPPKNIKRMVFVDAWSWDYQAPDGDVSLISCYWWIPVVFYTILTKDKGGREGIPMCFQHKSQNRVELYLAIFMIYVLVNFCVYKDKGN